MFNNKSNISIDVLYDDMKRQQDDMREQWRLYEELRKRVNHLYKKDYYGTERPRVDLLSDVQNEQEINLWNALNKLQKRMEKLEEKNKK